MDENDLKMNSCSYLLPCCPQVPPWPQSLFLQSLKIFPNITRSPKTLHDWNSKIRVWLKKKTPSNNRNHFFDRANKMEKNYPFNLLLNFVYSSFKVKYAFINKKFVLITKVLRIFYSSILLLNWAFFILFFLFVFNLKNVFANVTHSACFGIP